MGFDITNVVNSVALNFDFDFIMIVIKGKRMSIVTAEIVDVQGSTEYRAGQRASGTPALPLPAVCSWAGY